MQVKEGVGWCTLCGSGWRGSPQLAASIKTEISGASDTQERHNVSFETCSSLAGLIHGRGPCVRTGGGGLHIGLPGTGHPHSEPYCRSPTGPMPSHGWPGNHNRSHIQSLPWRYHHVRRNHEPEPRGTSCRPDHLGLCQSLHEVPGDYQ